MPFATTNDGVRLHYEETGSGSAVIFVHEFAGDHRSWEPQMRHFGRRHRCIAFNARGYSPSDVPEEVGAYSQARAADDVRSVLDRPVELNHGHAELSFLRNFCRGTTGLAAASPLRFSEPFRAGSGECPQLALEMGEEHLDLLALASRGQASSLLAMSRAISRAPS